MIFPQGIRLFEESVGNHIMVAVTPRRMLSEWGSGLVRKAPNKDLSGMALVLLQDGSSPEKHRFTVEAIAIAV